MDRKKLVAVFAVQLGVLLACGRAPKSEALFTDANAWKGPIVEGDAQISPEEFRRQIESGELVLTSSASLEAAKHAREELYRKDKEALEAIPDKSPQLRRLLEEVARNPGYEGDRRITRADGQDVVLLGRATQLRNAVEIHQRAQSRENALADYTQTYALLSDDLKAKAPAPDDLAGKPLEDVRAALRLINDLLAGSPLLKAARPELAGAPRSRDSDLSAGHGTDSGGACTSKNLVGKYWFPLKSFVSPVKDQGRRGTCWAFTAIGAVESRERVQNGIAADLSEQFLVNKVREDWDPDDSEEGYWPEAALETASDHGQGLPSEASWTYNQARSRPAADPGSFANTCNDYDGTCSETAHESRRVCTTVLIKFCGYSRVTYSGAGTAPGRTTLLWEHGQDFDLDRYRLLLAEGHVMMAQFPVYTGFMDDENIQNGVVSDYRITHKDGSGKQVDGSYGNHAVQIVGFLSNEEVAVFGVPADAGGGGYFIVKNSWGCVAGDGGYYYVPAKYVSDLFHSLSVLNFDGRRSAAWTAEQQLPGGSLAPAIEIRSYGARLDLRVKSDLAGLFKVSHPVARAVNLKVVSDRDGVLFDGPWTTDPNALIGSALERAFDGEGWRSLSLTASYGSSAARASLSVDVVNSAPVLGVDSAGVPSQGEEFHLAALIRDINEADAGLLCANTVWSVAAPDKLASATGCQQTVIFGATGLRRVLVTTRDSEGAVASQNLAFDVLPPPPNPYPRIKRAGLGSSELVSSGIRFVCGEAAVGVGSSINLRDGGCVIGMHRYWASAEVENPAGEALTYDWTLYVTNASGENKLYGIDGSASLSFGLSNYGNAIPVTNDCRVTLTVNAPDPTRSKSQTVWSGKCSYDALQLR